MFPAVKGTRDETLIGLFLEPFQKSNHILSPKWCQGVSLKLQAVSHHPALSFSYTKLSGLLHVTSFVFRNHNLKVQVYFSDGDLA